MHQTFVHEPRHPPQAARIDRRLVQLRFTIDKQGGVTDVEVIDSEPVEYLTESSCIVALEVQAENYDGKPVRQGMTVQLDFTRWELRNEIFSENIC